MLRVVTGPEMAEIDRRTIEDLGLPGSILMEVAGRAVAQHCHLLREQARVVVAAGPGNNGGDGYVVARTLQNLGHRVTVVSPTDPARLKGDAGNARLWAENFAVPIERSSELPECDLVVDSLFGTGLTRDLSGDFASLVNQINACDALKVAVDIPSGVCSQTGQTLGVATRVDLCVTFGLPKYGHYLQPGAHLRGRLEIEEIGFARSILQESPAAYLMTPEQARGQLPETLPWAHKGSQGRVFLVTGSHDYPGAASLCALAALRAGSGLVYAHVPDGIRAWVEPTALEAIFVSDDRSPQCDVNCVGPGLGSRLDLAEQVLNSSTNPTVVDADALTLLKPGPQPGPRILTPHPGEMGRLLGRETSSIQADRVGALREAVEKFQATVILKGNPTLVGGPDRPVCINSSGGPNLAQGGSGDVLAGVVTALAGRGCSPWQAATLGTYLHGLAGDELLKTHRHGAQALAEALPKALFYVGNHPRRQN